MSDQTETPTDPWANIDRYDLEFRSSGYTGSDEMVRRADGDWAQWDAVDAARRQADAQFADMAANQLVLQEAVATQSDLIARLTAERDALLTLLAILHSDGGHHTQEVGITQSIQDAHQVWARLLTERDSALQEIARLRTALAQPWGIQRWTPDAWVWDATFGSYASPAAASLALQQHLNAMPRDAGQLCIRKQPPVIR